MPTMSKPSQRLTWRPGVNQRTTRGFIRRGAKSAQSLAQHFYNHFLAGFVTSIGPFPCQSNRAYNPDRIRRVRRITVRGARNGTKEVALNGDQGRGRHARGGGPKEGAS